MAQKLSFCPLFFFVFFQQTVLAYDILSIYRFLGDRQMENIFKYLDDTQYDSIYDRPFNELDLLILTELAYLSFDGLVASDLDLDKSKRLQDIAENYPQEQSMMHTRNRLKLLEKASQTKRFKNIKLMGFINYIDLETEKQFAA